MFSDVVEVLLVEGDKGDSFTIPSAKATTGDTIRERAVKLLMRVCFISNLSILQSNGSAKTDKGSSALLSSIIP